MVVIAEILHQMGVREGRAGTVLLVESGTVARIGSKLGPQLLHEEPSTLTLDLVCEAGGSARGEGFGIFWRLAFGGDGYEFGGQHKSWMRSSPLSRAAV